MAITTTEINSWINKAQQRIGEWGLRAAELELAGENADKLFWKLRYLSGAINVLQSDIDDLTLVQKEKIVSCMISIGQLGPLSVVNFSFQTVNIVNLNGTYDGLTDTPLSKVGFDKQIPSVQEATNTHIYKKLGIGINTLVVSNEGEDATAQKGNLLYHWRTLSVAKTAALSGDVILVLPGTYLIPDGVNLYKDGITYNFMSGAIINSVSTTPAFDSTGGIDTFKIEGDGLFNNNVTNPLIAVHSGQDFIISGKFIQNNDDDIIEVFEDATLTLRKCILVLSNTTKKAVEFNVADGNTNGAEIFVYDAWSNQNPVAPSALLNFKINSIQLDPEVV